MLDKKRNLLIGSMACGLFTSGRLLNLQSQSCNKYIVF